MGRLLCCGSNGDYQLGLGDDIDRNSVKEVELAAEVNSNLSNARMACGGQHTLLLLANGEVYGCGSNRRGQLYSNGTDKPVCGKFGAIEPLKEVVAICAGWEFSIAATKYKIFVAGHGSNGELGLGHVTETSLGEIELPGVVKMKSSIHSTMVQLENGLVYGWGNNKKGQLFPHNGDKQLKTVWSPKELDFDGEVVDFALGRDFTVIVLKVADGLKLELRGVDRFNIMKTLQAVDLSGFKSVQTMWSSVHITLQSGLISAGNNSHGQLFPDRFILGDRYTVGSEHGLVVRNGHVYAWGWGEHGNCGINRIESVVFDYLSEIYKCSSPVQVFGGCATSFILVT